MEILGHARIAVTLGIYTAADDASRRLALRKLSALFGTHPDWPLLLFLLSSAPDGRCKSRDRPRAPARSRA
jgi:hypothetical protein